jgi:predicted amidohydrolase YtcJ
MLIKRAGLLDGTVADIRVGATIEALAKELTPRPDEDVLDARGALLIPGLHDHHLHVRAAAAATGSVNVGPPQVRDSAQLARALADAAVGADGWVRAVGYHDSVAGPLDRIALDALAPATPIRVQHRSGILWTLNSLGLRRIGLADHPDGRLRSADTGWTESITRRDTELSELGKMLASYGVTGITDATPDLVDAEALAGYLPQHVHWLSPGKRILHDDRLDLDDLTDWVRATHARGTAVALHCVTVAQLVVTVAALREAGPRPGDRIEHAAMVPDDCAADLAALGVTVVTQPNFVAERGDQYLADIPAQELDQLWRVGSLLAVGIPVALSTDAPFGDADPWAAMRAAVHRQTPSGTVLGLAECVSPRTALTMFLGSARDPARPREVAPGQPGDLCLLTAPRDVVLAELDAALVAATIIGGQVVQAQPGTSIRCVPTTDNSRSASSAGEPGSAV